MESITVLEYEDKQTAMIVMKSVVANTQRLGFKLRTEGVFLQYLYVKN